MFKKVLFFLLFFYTIVGFVVVPYVLKSEILKVADEQLNAKLSIDKIYFNPYVFKLTMSGVELSSLENKPLAKFNVLDINLELYSLFNKTIHIKDLCLDKPVINLVHQKTKTINLLNILKPIQKNQTSSSDTEPMILPRIMIDNVALKSGKLFFEDNTVKEKFTFAFYDIGFKLKDVDTHDFNQSQAKLQMYTALEDGGFININTEVVGFEPLEIKGNIDFQASKLYSEYKYIKEQLNLEIADGRISLHTDYHVDFNDLNNMTLDNLNIFMEGLRVVPKHAYHDILTLNSLLVSDVVVKPLKQDVEIASISLNRLKIVANRNKNAQIDWMKYSKIEATKEDDNKSKKSAPVWNVRLKELKIENVSAAFTDKAVSPTVTSKVNELNLYANNITLKGEKPFDYHVDILLNNKTKCNLNGAIKHSILDISSQLSCRNFDVVDYKPYIDTIANQELKQYNINLNSLFVDLDMNTELKQDAKAIGVFLHDSNLTLSKFSLSKKSNREKLVQFKALKLDGIELDLSKKKLSIKETVLTKANLSAQRYHNQELNFDNLIVPKQTKKTNKKQEKQKKSKDFDVELKHFAIKDAQVDFRDRAFKPSIQHKIDKINFDAYNVKLEKESWLNYKLIARVNTKGIIKASGKLRHTPLKEEGVLELDNIHLKNLNPYLQEQTFINIDDGKISLKSKTYYAPSDNNPDLRVNGVFGLKDLFVSDSRNQRFIVSLIDLKLKSFTFEYKPNRFYIDEADLTSFYIDARVDEHRQMNLSKLMKPKPEIKEMQEEKKVKTEEKFPFKILKIKVDSGSAHYADYSLPLKFNTNIHDVNGEIYSISNNPEETSYIDMSGEIDKYGSTKLKGSVNSANPKVYMDLNFNFKNLDLNNLSAYSASFAGHEIDSGKMSLDLGYKIKDSKLVGENSIMVKKIKVGKEIKDKNVTVLPLGFVVALLENSKGIIDIEMPVTGDVDAPDFKYGTLIWKTFTNLIAKAVSAPFRFLGSMLGINGDTLSFVEFEGASFTILPTEREKLDNIAKMMQKRPKIQLHIIPTYNKFSDKKAMQLNKLIAYVLKKSENKNKEKHENVMNVTVLESIYKDFKDDDKLSKLKIKLEKKYKDEEFDRMYLSALVRICSKLQLTPKSELENLAQKRAQVMKKYLVHDKFIEPTRILIDPINVLESKDDDMVKLSLQVEVN